MHHQNSPSKYSERHLSNLSQQNAHISKKKKMDRLTKSQDSSVVSGKSSLWRPINFQTIFLVSKVLVGEICYQPTGWTERTAPELSVSKAQHPWHSSNDHDLPGSSANPARWPGHISIQSLLDMFFCNDAGEAGALYLMLKSKTYIWKATLYTKILKYMQLQVSPPPNWIYITVRFMMACQLWHVAIWSRGFFSPRRLGTRWCFEIRKEVYNDLYIIHFQITKWVPYINPSKTH